MDKNLIQGNLGEHEADRLIKELNMADIYLDFKFYKIKESDETYSVFREVLI